MYNPKNISVPIKKSNCNELYDKLPWLNRNVTGIYVNPIQLSKLFYDENSPITFNNIVFYKIKPPYFNMRCLGKISRINNDIVHYKYFFRENIFQVCIEVDNTTYMIQTGKMFEDELNFVNEQTNVKSPNKYQFKINYGDENLKTCITLYRRLPWYKDNIESIYINPIKISNEYYDDSNYIELSDVKFYVVKLSYYYLRCLGKIVSISETGELTMDYNNELLMFQVGIQKSKGTVIIQTQQMFNDEKTYISNFKKSGISLSEWKQMKVSPELKKIAIGSLNEYIDDKNYSTSIIDNIPSDNSYEFAKTVSKIYMGLRLNPVFNKKIKKQYYSVDIIPLLQYPNILEGVEYDDEKIDVYVEDIATNMLLYSSPYFDIPKRRQQRNELRPLKLNNVNIKMKCGNFNDVKNIPDENIVFYETENSFLCFDILKLYLELKSGNVINPYTGQPFNNDFIEKVIRMYNIKNKKSETIVENDDENYDEIVRRFDELVIDKNFELLLEKVRFEISKFETQDDKCFICKKNIGNITSITTLNKRGQTIKHCSKECFEKM